MDKRSGTNKAISSLRDQVDLEFKEFQKNLEGGSYDELPKLISDNEVSNKKMMEALIDKLRNRTDFSGDLEKMTSTSNGDRGEEMQDLETVIRVIRMLSKKIDHAKLEKDKFSKKIVEIASKDKNEIKKEDIAEVKDILKAVSKDGGKGDRPKTINGLVKKIVHSQEAAAASTSGSPVLANAQNLSRPALHKERSQ